MSGYELVIDTNPAVACQDVCISHRRHRFPPVEFADRLEAWGAASLFGGFKLLPLDCGPLGVI
jgi:hypothetical protein